jgi:tetratricopeptide (TPR) repeat protein
MMSCILIFYLAVLSGPAQAQAPAADADALYAQREDIARARQAAGIWSERLMSDPRDFDAAWKLARTHYWLGTRAPKRERKEFLERGVDAGRTAAALDPRRPEGHFWMAANMGALAESFGLRQGLKYRGAIRDALLTVLAVDAGYQQGSADRALGRWYFKVPALFGGSRKKSEQHLRRSLTYNPNSIASRFFLAETLLGLDRKADAIAELQRVVDLPPDPAWIPEDRDFKQQAQRLLVTLRQKR